MQIRIWSSNITAQLRVDALDDTINGVINTSYEFNIAIDESMLGLSLIAIVNGNTYPISTTTVNSVVTVPSTELDKNIMTFQVRKLAGSTVINSNIVAFTVTLSTSTAALSTITKIANFPVAGTDVNPNDTFRVAGDLYFAENATVIPSSITPEWLSTNFSTNSTGSGSASSNNYNDLINKPIINGKVISGTHNIDYYGGYILPSTGIPSSDLDAAIMNIINTNTSNISTLQSNVATLSGQINTFAQSVDNLSDVVATKYTKPVDGIPKTDLAAVVNTSLSKADTALQSTSSINLIQLPQIPANTILGNNTGSSATPIAIPIPSGSIGSVDSVTTLPTAVLITVDNNDMSNPKISETAALTSAVAKANSALQSVAISTTSTPGIVYLEPTDGSGTNPNSALTKAYTAIPPIPVLEDAHNLLRVNVSGNGYETIDPSTLTVTAEPPEGGWTASQLSSGVNTSLSKADTALQTFTETDPTVPTWAKQPTMPSDTTKMDKIVTSTQKMLKSNVTGNASESTLSESDLSATVSAVTTLNASSSTSGSVAYQVAAETTRATNAESALSSRVDTLEGTGGYAGSYNFGTATPTQSALLTQMMYVVWGTSGTVTINTPLSASTWVLDTTTHTASELFNGTRITNLYDNNTWSLTNTPTTVPAVFEFANIGSTSVAIATSLAAGIVKSDNSADVAAEFVVDASGNVTLTEKYTSPSSLAGLSGAWSTFYSTRDTIKNWMLTIFRRLFYLDGKATDFDSHAANATVHITSAERTLWNSKRDGGNIPITDIVPGGANQIPQTNESGTQVTWVNMPTGTSSITGITAGNGLSGGGTTGDVTVTMGTPSTINTSSTNTASGTTHTHALSGVQSELSGTEGNILTFSNTSGIINSVPQANFATSAQGTKADTSLQPTAQTFDSAQKAQILTNIGAAPNTAIMSITGTTPISATTVGTATTITHASQSASTLTDTPITPNFGESFSITSNVASNATGHMTSVTKQTVSMPQHTHTGDVTSANSNALTIAANAVTNSKLAQCPANTLKGNNLVTNGNALDLTASQVRTMLNVADGSKPGDLMSVATPSVVYANDNTGVPSPINYTSSATASTVVTRTATGTIKAVNGTADDDVATVDQLNDKQDAISAGTAGNLVTYSGTIGTVGSQSIKSLLPKYDVSILTSGWVASTDISGYGYQYNITNEAITTDCVTDFILDYTSVVVAETAIMANATREMAGSVRVYAKNIPSATLTGKLIVLRGE